MLDNTLFWNILTVMSIIVEWRIFKLILDEFNIHKKNKLTINISFIILITITTILTIAKVQPNIKLFVGMVIGYIFYIYNYKFTVLKSLIISLIYWMVLIGSDAISSGIILTINSIENIYDLLNNNIFRLEITILSKVILVSIVPLIKGLKLQIELKKLEFIYIIIPVIANLVSIIVIFGLAMNRGISGYSKDLIILIISVILFLSNISLIHVVGSIIKNNNLNIENKIIKEKIDMQYKHYLTLQEAQMKVRKLYHDMHNHMTCIQNIYGKNEIAEKYINNIKGELCDWNSIYTTGNMILDIILNEKKNICYDNEIKLYVDIEFTKCEFIDMLDVCSIFSNMLDNAIEACIKIKDTDIDRYIKVKGTIVNGFFIIKCENSKINRIKLENNNMRTDKEDKFLHGIGISSIKNSVKRYNGEVSIDYSENKFIMKIYIPLK